MSKKNIMRDFVNEIYNRKLMTKFIKNIFGYKNFYDYNYLFRMIDNDCEIIIDIYDNVSDNRFNRYIFSFIENEYVFKVVEEKNVFVNYISVLLVEDCDDNLMKLAYLFQIPNMMMLDYASTFLDEVFVEILSDVLK